MKIEYDILWIEDDKNWIRSIEKRALLPLINIGLEPVVKIAKNQAEALNFVRQIQFDLILVDYRLDGSTGDDVIQAIRRSNQFTTILFYSSDGDVKIRNHISEKGIDGVFCAGRDRGSFIKAIHELINISTIKFQHINNIRGLAMAEVSEMEETMRDILLHYLNQDKGKAEEIKNYVVKTIKESAKNSQKAIAKLVDGGDALAIVNSRVFDAEKKSMTIQKLAKLLAEDMKELHSFHQSYKVSISDKRNILGHVVGNVEGNVTSFDSKGGKIICDEEFCIKFRTDLREHKQLLTKLREYLKLDSNES